MDPGRRRYFLDDLLPPLLRALAEADPPAALVDLGAGDGGVLWALERAGLLAGEAVAVDLSPERVALCESLSPRVRGLVADATSVAALPDGAADAVVASQLVEHLPDDRALAPEIARLLRPGGWFYVSSVARGRRAWWVYRVDGRVAVDPTHLREYRSPEDFAAALAEPRLRQVALRSRPLRFPLLDLLLRALVLVGLLPAERLPGLYVRRPRLARLRLAVRVRVPGYRWVELAGRRV
ncbi:MAG TPA: class I SAM-dependent methyltransferase [Gaiellaceae bacterium]|nr:class I SAM-dependent methyltransferase [Gaiellaceae bacterium]